MPRVDVIVPTTHPNAHDAIHEIQQLFVDYTDGFSQYDGTGGWFNGEELVTEPHVRILASHEDLYIVELIRDESVEIVKRLTDEDAVYTEIVDSNVSIK